MFFHNIGEAPGVHSRTWRKRGFPHREGGMMEYNINFCIISVAFLSITAFFYSRQARVPSRRSALFDALLWCGVLALLLDIVSALADRYASMLPVWLLFAINITLLLSEQVSGVLFFFYAISLTGTYRRMGKGLRVLILLPFAVVATLIIISPFSRYGIFYLDADNIYRHGISYLTLYAVMAMYLVSSLVIVFVRRKRLQRIKFYTILAFLMTVFIAMLIQMNRPYLLLNTTANAFALTLIYHILEAPGAHIDALTGVFNRTALTGMLRDLFEEGERCTLLIFTLNSLHLVNHSFGMKGGDAALIAFADYLQKNYPHHNIFRTEGDIFCVLFAGGRYLASDGLAALDAGTRHVFRINAAGTEVTLDTSLACVNSEDCASAGEMISLLESLMRLHRGGELGSMQVADAAFKESLLQKEAIERATERALEEQRVEVYYQPIHQADGRLCAIEALIRIQDPEMGFLPPQELVEIAERNGSIIRLGEQVLRRVCEFVRDNRVADWGLDHVGVNLSAVQCVREELPQEVGRILAEYDVAPGLIAFEVTETAAGALVAVRENMERLLGKGIYFLLDDFGTGYANFKNMAALPFRCIKIDRSLLWNAQGSRSRTRLLAGVVKVIHTLGLASLCEGVETAEQVALLQKLGVSMLQGYYFSKPLPPERFVEYVGKAGEA